MSNTDIFDSVSLDIQTKENYRIIKQKLLIFRNVMKENGNGFLA